MSVNPLAGAAPADIAALVTQELAALAADAQTLATQLLPGDVVPAVVLSSNGLTDLLSVNGLRVAAELPPSLLPGDNITVMVTGFDGERINLRIVPSPQPAPNETPSGRLRPTPPAIAGTTPPSPAPPSPPVAEPSPAAATAVPAASPAAAAGSTEAATPPSLPSAAASLGSSPAVRAAGSQTDGRAPAGAAGAVPAPARTPFAEYGPRAAPAPAAPVLKTIEARLAAAHAAPVPPAPPVGPKPASPLAGRQPASPAAAAPVPRPPIVPRPPPTVSSPAPRPQAPPATDGKRPFGALPRVDVARPPLPVAAAATRPPIATRPLAAPVAAGAASAPPAPPRGPAAFAEPAALLRALSLPVTPTNLALARMALESPEKLPNALAALERALANDADPRVATLSTLTSFVARIDPRSPVLAAQIAAFVDHVVTGREAKIAQLAAADDSAPPASSKSAASAEPETSPASSARVREAPAPAAANAARVAVVRAALDYDLKTQLLAVAAGRAGATDPAAPNAGLDRAVAGALSAITALQLNAASTLSAHPEGLTFTLPVALPGGFAQAHVRVDRDAPNGRKIPLDGDNFHIAFVLETRHLGTVAIDVVTVGRTVTLSVKTEAVVAQRVFASALSRLSARLESLRYRVAKADAAVAPPAAAEASSTRPVAGPAPDAVRLVDVDA